MSNKYITTVQQYGDTEDYFIEIPDEICKELGWEEGDTIDWQIDKEGIIISKIKDTDSIKEKSRETNNWYSIKAAYIEDYLNSESEGKDFDTYYETSIEENSSIEGYEFP